MINFFLLWPTIFFQGFPRGPKISLSGSLNNCLPTPPLSSRYGFSWSNLLHFRSKLYRASPLLFISDSRPLQTNRKKGYSTLQDSLTFLTNDPFIASLSLCSTRTTELAKINLALEVPPRNGSHKEFHQTHQLGKSNQTRM